MDELWAEILGFDGYSVSTLGRIRSDISGRILISYPNQSGLMQIGLVRAGRQEHRSVPLLVAKAFVPIPEGPYDTPINLDGNRQNNRVDNLAWRPRWFAVKYHRQFQRPDLIEKLFIGFPFEDMATGEITANSLECAKAYGLLHDDLIVSLIHNTYVWPTYQQFRLVQN